MDFSRAPIWLILGWPILLLVAAGALSIFAAFGYGLWWAISHLAWVP